MRQNDQKGFVQTIIIVLIGIIIMSFFGIDLEQVSKSDLLKKNLAFTWNTVKSVAIDDIYNPIVNFFKSKSS